MQRINRGFTLIEMMVSLSIFSMLVAVLMAGYSQGLSLWERSQAESGRWLSIQHRHELLRQLVGQALVADYRDEQGVSYPYFIADQRNLMLLTRAPVLDMPGYVRPVRITFEHRGSELYDLYYQEGNKHSDPERGIDWDGARRVRLLEGVHKPATRFLAPATPMPPELEIAHLSDREMLRYRKEPEWLTWYDGAILWKPPKLVQLSFEDRDGDSHVWTFRLPAEADAWSLGREQ